MVRSIVLEDYELLAKRFFGRGFATLTKSEIEVYLFDIYMRGIEREGRTPTYYAIGRELGITESRVRSLTEKRSLQFYEPPSVEDCLFYLLEHAPTDLQDNVIRIQVSNINILHALQDHLESNELGYEPELSGKAFRITLPVFFNLLDKHFGLEVTSKAVKQVVRQARESNRLVESAEARTLSEIARDPNTYGDLLEPLIINRNPISFLRRLGDFIREAQLSAN